MAKKTSDYPKEFDLPQEGQAQSAPERAVEATNKNYEPNQATLEKLKKLPWDEIKAEIGLDLDYLLKTTKHYGPLEAIAYGRFSEPLNFLIKRGHEQSHQEFGTIRFYSFKGENGKTDWGYEIHHVNQRPKLDENGAPVLKDGVRVMEIDRNELKAVYDEKTGYVKGEEALVYKKQPLTEEQVRHLRLTGNLGEPFKTAGFRGEEVSELLSVDPYNNHKLIAVRADVVRARYLANPTVILKGGDRATLTEDQAKGIADGDYIFVTTEKGEKKCLQFDCYEGKVKPCISYDLAVKKDIRKDVEQGQGKTQSQSQAKAEDKTQEQAPMRTFQRGK